MESTYIQRNINATQQAYGLDKVKVEQYKATTKGKSGALSSEAESTAQIRLLDPQVRKPDTIQLQADRRSEVVGHQRWACHWQKHGGTRSEPPAC